MSRSRILVVLCMAILVASSGGLLLSIARSVGAQPIPIIPRVFNLRCIPDPEDIVYGGNDFGPYTVPTGKLLIVTDIAWHLDGGALQVDGQDRFRQGGQFGNVQFNSGIPFRSGEVINTSTPVTWWSGYLALKQARLSA